MSSGQAELMAQEIGERQPHLDVFLVTFAIDRQRDVSLLAHRFWSVTAWMLRRRRGWADVRSPAPRRGAKAPPPDAGGRRRARARRRWPRTCGRFRRPPATACRRAHGR